MAGVGWGAFAAFFCGVVPMLWIRWGQRRGYWGDRHVRRREDRLIVLPGVIVSVVVCLGGLALLGGPREVTALVVAMLATVVAILAVTTRWKISVHTAVAGGAVAVLALAYGPRPLAAYVLVALVGWSRVRLRDHTAAQAVAGAGLGAAVAGAVFVALR
ncbi:phosphatase PAP2 family protein [Streptomyces sp. NPDC029003]|uniref:phosphatase PAP2 family protein n=1 Tax=Streptomyces sp. NPDC029003 TaxID=3155125 RepID=UPI0033FF02A8